MIDTKEIRKLYGKMAVVSLLCDEVVRLREEAGTRDIFIYKADAGITPYPARPGEVIDEQEKVISGLRETIKSQSRVISVLKKRTEPDEAAIIAELQVKKDIFQKAYQQEVATSLDRRDVIDNQKKVISGLRRNAECKRNYTNEQEKVISELQEENAILKSSYREKMISELQAENAKLRGVRADRFIEQKGVISELQAQLSETMARLSGVRNALS